MSPACLPGVQSSGTEGHAEQRRTVVTPLLWVCVLRGCGGVGTGGGGGEGGRATTRDSRGEGNDRRWHGDRSVKRIAYHCGDERGRHWYR